MGGLLDFLKETSPGYQILSGGFENKPLDWQAMMTPEMKAGQKQALEYLMSGMGKGATPLPSNMPITSPVPSSAFQAMNIPMSYFLGMPYSHRGMGTAEMYGAGGMGAGTTGAGVGGAGGTTPSPNYPASIPPGVSGEPLPITPFEVYRQSLRGQQQPRLRPEQPFRR